MVGGERGEVTDGQGSVRGSDNGAVGVKADWDKGRAGKKRRGRRRAVRSAGEGGAGLVRKETQGGRRLCARTYRGASLGKRLDERTHRPNICLSKSAMLSLAKTLARSV